MSLRFLTLIFRVTIQWDESSRDIYPTKDIHHFIVGGAARIGVDERGGKLAGMGLPRVTHATYVARQIDLHG